MNNYLGTDTLESMSQAKFYNKWTLAKFEKYLKDSIVEVGAGIGNFTQTLSKYGKVFAFDIEKKFVENFKKVNNPQIEAGYGNLEEGKYFFKDRKFKTVVCINVLEHIRNDKKAVESLYKLLEKDGHLILLVPIYDFLYGDIDKSIGHFRRYDPSQLIFQLEKVGFKIVKTRKLNFLGAIGWFVSGKILKNRQVSENKIRLFNLVAPAVLYLEDLIEPPIGTSILVIAKKE